MLIIFQAYLLINSHVCMLTISQVCMLIVFHLCVLAISYYACLLSGISAYQISGIHANHLSSLSANQLSSSQGYILIIICQVELPIISQVCMLIISKDFMLNITQVCVNYICTHRGGVTCDRIDLILNPLVLSSFPFLKPMENWWRNAGNPGYVRDAGLCGTNMNTSQASALVTKADHYAVLGGPLLLL